MSEHALALSHPSFLPLLSLSLSLSLSLFASIHTLYFYPISTLPSFVGWFSFTHSLILLLAGLGQACLTLTSILHSQSATTIPTLSTLLDSIRLVSCCCGCSVQGVQTDENLSFSDSTKILTFSHYFSSSTLLVLLCACVFRNSFQLLFQLVLAFTKVADLILFTPNAVV